MATACTLVLDVGKTNAKLTLWDQAGTCLARQVRANRPSVPGAYPTLDLAGLEGWVKETVRTLAAEAEITTIIPVTHGAAAVLIEDDRVFTPPMDYEAAIPEEVAAAYAAGRDPFSATGSPRLPSGLNLGAQLAYLETLSGPWPEPVRILLWPQYWAWRFSGMMASEVTSLGCHSDLWRPIEARFSDLATARGWSWRLPPLRRAQEVLGTVTAEWQAAGLPSACRVLCGLHDSNAALLAARGHDEIAQGDATIVSTGTWFVAMRSPAEPAAIPPLPQGRDCLLNVDANGRPSPSARFMAGREAELIAGLDPFRPAGEYGSEALIAELPGLISAGIMVLPSFVLGVGPFPRHSGGWTREPSGKAARQAALGLYLAMMTEACLELIGARDLILVEGRFAEVEVFTRALATLRRSARVYVSNAQDDVPFGARRLADSSLRPTKALRRVEPLGLGLDTYRARWRGAVEAADR